MPIAFIWRLRRWKKERIGIRIWKCDCARNGKYSAKSVLKMKADAHLLPLYPVGTPLPGCPRTVEFPTHHRKCVSSRGGHNRRGDLPVGSPIFASTAIAPFAVPGGSCARRCGLAPCRPRHTLMPRFICHRQRGATRPPTRRLPRVLRTLAMTVGYRYPAQNCQFSIDGTSRGVRGAPPVAE